MSPNRKRHPRLVGPLELTGLLAIAALAVAVVVALTAIGDPVPGDLRAAPVAAADTCPDAPAADLVTSAELLACPDVYDGVEVTIEGEVVGAVLRRDGGAWLQVNDDAYANAVGPLPASGVRAGANSSIAVFAPDSLADAIGSIGGPQRVGDRLRIAGTYLRSDPADAGAPTLRAVAAEVLLPGRPIERRATPGRVAAAALGVAVTGVLIVAARRAGHR